MFSATKSAKFSSYRSSVEVFSESDEEDRCPSRRDQHRPDPEEEVLVHGTSVKAAEEPFDNSHLGFLPQELDEHGLLNNTEPMEVNHKNGPNIKVN
jgi:hypothetical protein